MGNNLYLTQLFIRLVLLYQYLTCFPYFVFYKKINIMFSIVVLFGPYKQKCAKNL